MTAMTVKQLRDWLDGIGWDETPVYIHITDAVRAQRMDRAPAVGAKHIANSVELVAAVPWADPDEAMAEKRGWERD